jgi:hypothetical protein
VTTEEQLAWEQRHRALAAVAAALAAVTAFFGRLITYSAYNDAPDAGPGAPLKAVDFLNDKATPLLVGAALSAIGLLWLAYLLGYLARATKARQPSVHRAILVVAVGGAVALAVSTLTFQVAVQMKVSDFVASGSRNYFEARDLLSSGIAIAAQTVSLAATLALAFGIVIISLNAMRVGLLTRFLGYLGIFVGVLTVFPIGSPIPIVQTFWLIAIALMLLEMWPRELHPAWRTGQAEPWPSSRGLPAGPPDESATPAPAPVGATTAAPQKRKRKRRR